MTLFLLPALLLILLAIPPGVRAGDHPADHWEVAVETGYLKKVRDNSPLDYVIEIGRAHV